MSEPNSTTTSEDTISMDNRRVVAGKELAQVFWFSATSETFQAEAKTLEDAYWPLERDAEDNYMPVKMSTTHAALYDAINRARMAEQSTSSAENLPRRIAQYKLDYEDWIQGKGKHLADKGMTLEYFAYFADMGATLPTMPPNIAPLTSNNIRVMGQSRARAKAAKNDGTETSSG